MIQSIKDKLVLNNEEYSADEIPEGEFNLPMGAAQRQLDAGSPGSVQVQFSIGRPAIQHDSQRARPPRGTEREPVLALRTRPVSNERQAATQSPPTTVQVWDSYTTDDEKTKRVELQPTREDAPAKRYSVASDRGDAGTSLQVMNVDRNTEYAASLVVPNFYPISQPEERVDNKDGLIRWTVRDHRTAARSSMRMRTALALEGSASPAGIGDSAERHSGFVTFKYKVKIPVEVPLSRRWIANVFVK